MRTIQPGSFVYENRFCVFPGDVFDIRIQAPPTIKDKFKAYYLFINQEIVDSFLDKQISTLSKLGILTSSTIHDDAGSAKLDVSALYATAYNSTPVEVCFIYIKLTDTFAYDIWIEYPPKSRTL
jgi:hypothetical protein